MKQLIGSLLLILSTTACAQYYPPAPVYQDQYHRQVPRYNQNALQGVVVAVNAIPVRKIVSQSPNVPNISIVGALVGALVGHEIFGHAAGAFAGAAIGSSVPQYVTPNQQVIDTVTYEYVVYCNGRNIVVYSDAISGYVANVGDTVYVLNGRIIRA